MTYRHTVGGRTFTFADLKMLLARATPLRSGDVLAGVAADSAQERVAAQMALADVPLTVFLTEAIIPYEDDEVTRLIVDTHDQAAFASVAHLTVGGLRDWLLSDDADTGALTRLAPGLMPEMAAAVSKIMRLQDLIVVGAKCRVVTRFRNTIGLAGRLSTRIQVLSLAAEPGGVSIAQIASSQGVLMEDAARLAEGLVRKALVAQRSDDTIGLKEHLLPLARAGSDTAAGS